MLFIALSLLGYVSYKQLPVELLPNAELPVLFVQVSSQQDMDPSYVESEVIIPLEGAVSAIGGVVGVGLSLILLIPGNMLIHSIADSASVTAALPLQAALVLIALATLLTILGGLIPAKSASKCDPVKALRSE